MHKLQFGSQSLAKKCFDATGKKWMRPNIRCLIADRHQPRAEDPLATFRYNYFPSPR